MTVRHTIPTIAIAAATFAATLAFAPTIADAAQHLDLSTFLTAPEKAPVKPVVARKPNCTNAWAQVVDALGRKDCLQ